MKDKENIILIIMIVIFLGSLIRSQFIPVLGFVVGVYVGSINKKEEWIKIK